MRLVVTSHGSTGDIYPLIAVAVALRGAGHSVRFATSPPFRGDVEDAGLEYFEVPPLWSRRELAYWMGRLQERASPLMQLRELYRAAHPHIPAIIDAMDQALAGADLLLSSYLFPMNRAIAERRGVRFATFAFAHNTVPSEFHPPEGIPRLSFAPRRLARLWNRVCWRIGNLAVDAIINGTVARQLRARGLPLVRDFFSRPADLVLVGVSPGLMRPASRLDSRFRFTGFCRWQPPENPTVEEELKAFTRGERVPVVTFGSMVYRDPDTWMRRLLAAWPHDRRLVVQRGWSGFEVPAGCNHVKLVGPVAHDQLLRHASVVIHHGGAGTTASALHAGRPQIVVPHIADQHFFAREVCRLGCGVTLARWRWPERLVEAVQDVASDADVLRAVARAQAVVRTENGPTAALRTIEAFLQGPAVGGGGLNQAPACVSGRTRSSSAVRGRAWQPRIGGAVEL